MSVTLRIILVLVSLMTCIWIVRKIQKSQAKIEDSVFWLAFSCLLILISVFPQIVEFGAFLAGVASPVNFLFLSIIFILLAKVFLLSVRLSQLESKLQRFVQTYALEHHRKKAEKTNTPSGGGGGEHPDLLLLRPAMWVGRMKVLVIIPAYNEAEHISQVVDRLIREAPDVDYIIINDCSRDETEKVCLEHHLHMLTLPVNLGIGGGVQTGYRYALKHGYDIAVQMDGDGQHDPAYLYDLIAPIAAGRADVVIGSRFLERSGFQSTGARRAGIRLLSGLIRLCTGIRVQDVTSGFRAVGRKLLAFYAEDYAQDYPEPEAIIAAAMRGARIVEIPVVMKERAGGQSSITPFRSIYYMIKVSLAILFYRITFKKGVRG